MKIATWNVNSIRLRLESMLEWQTRTGTDVLCVQETKVIDADFPFQAIEDAGFYVAFFGQKSYNGVAIISKHEIEDVQKGFLDDDDEQPKRLIAATIRGVRVVNTYVPNGTELWTDKFTFKLDWLQRLRKMFDDNCELDKDALLCGDINVAMNELDVWSVADMQGKLHFSKPERAAMHNVKQWGFVDAFRKMNGDVQEFSWWDFRSGAWPKNQGLRIDYIWVSPALAEKCTGCWIDKEPRGGEKPSDHTPVVADFHL